MEDNLTLSSYLFDTSLFSVVGSEEEEVEKENLEEAEEWKCSSKHIDLFLDHTLRGT